MLIPDAAPGKLLSDPSYAARREIVRAVVRLTGLGDHAMAAVLRRTFQVRTYELECFGANGEARG